MQYCVDKEIMPKVNRERNDQNMFIVNPHVQSDFMNGRGILMTKEI